MLGCQTNNLVEEFNNNYAPEKKAIIYNKYEELNKNNIPLNGMIMVEENETLYSIANAAETSPLKIRLRAKKWFT